VIPISYRKNETCIWP